MTLLNMMLGEVAPGGTGSGLYGMLVLAVITVFVAGLMVGRTPEYLGKKLRAREVKFASLYLLTTPTLVLVGTATAMALPGQRAGMLNTGPHGFSEVLYAFTSAAKNNGSAFAGISVYTTRPHLFPGVGTWSTRGGLALMTTSSTLTAPPTPPVRPERKQSPGRVQGGLLDPRLLWQAMPDALRKLDPRTLWKNPVMFIVEVGAVFTTVLAIASSSTFSWLIVVWLWLTVLFANLAEAVAEGRGKAQADALRRAKTDTIARRLVDPAVLDGAEEPVPAPELRPGDRVVCEAGDVIPGDGDVIDGVASVDESAITGESAPVIRESGGDRSSVTGGTRVLSDRIVVEITQKPGECFIDRMIALVEGARRQKTPNEIALNILLASLTIIFLLATVILQPMAIFAKANQPGIGNSAALDSNGITGIVIRLAARLSHPNHDRRVAISDRYRRYGPARAAQCARHEWTSRRSRGRRQHTIAR